ncbi:MAG: beta-ketoacyl-[acyl-carrier-protein] synthase family protein [Gemmatimonadaceae bacterium]|nr:beta-ketoacyl-[acyl-carrier-protein] synthase family protein [Gemmatimonadaceae bacterium]
MSSPRRVVVTGLGAITPIGIGLDALRASLRAERSAVGTITRFDPSPFRTHIAAQVNDFDAEDHLEAKRVKRLDRFGQLSVIAANMAIADSGIDLTKESRENIGVMMGTALAGVGYAEAQLGRYLAGGLRAVDATLALAVFGGASSCNIAIETGVQGPNSTNAMSCASGAIAIGEAYRQVRDGYADVMIGGGAEAPLAPLCFGAFALIRAMSTRNDDPAHASRPFDSDRDGFVMGEGGAALILEERSRAIARGARIYGELVGFGTTNDAHHMTAPLPGGAQAARAMRQALARAELSPSDIDYVNAHASATPLNDPTEVDAMRTVFGTALETVWVSGTKGYHGHALGASGAIEAVICMLSIADGWLPPTVNLEQADAACAVRHVPTGGITTTPKVVMSNSFGFGGINASLVFRAPD